VSGKHDVQDILFPEKELSVGTDQETGCERRSGCLGGENVLPYGNRTQTPLSFFFCDLHC